MRLTVNQLRRIIKEEVSNARRRNHYRRLRENAEANSVYYYDEGGAEEMVEDMCMSMGIPMPTMSVDRDATDTGGMQISKLTFTSAEDKMAFLDADVDGNFYESKDEMTSF